MPKRKRRFKNIQEMRSFLAEIRKRTEDSIKRLQIENKKYEKLLKEAEAALKEPRIQYKSKGK